MLFAIDYALGRIVMNWSRRPAALLGHSVGEMTAATLSGVFALPDAVALVHGRLKHVDGLPDGIHARGGRLGRRTPAVPAWRGGDRGGERSTTDRALWPFRRTCRAARRLGGAGICLPSGGCQGGLPRLRAGVPRHGVRTGLRPRTAASALAYCLLDRHRRTAVSTERDQAVLLGSAAGCSSAVLARVERTACAAAARDRRGRSAPGGGLAPLARQHPSVRSGQSEVLAVLPTRPRSPRGDLRPARAVADRVGSA